MSDFGSLLLRFAQDDQAATSSLSRELFAISARIAMNFGLSSEDARDAVQDVLTDLVRRPELIETIRHPRAFLHTTIRHRLMAVRRKRAREVEWGAVDLEAYLTEPGRLLDEEEVARIVLGAIRKLPAQAQELAHFHFVQGLSPEQISSRLHLSSERAYRRLLYKTIKLLRDLVLAELETDFARKDRPHGAGG